MESISGDSLFFGEEGGGVEGRGIARYPGFRVMVLQVSPLWPATFKRESRGRYGHSTVLVSGGLVRVPVCSVKVFLTCDLVFKASRVIPRDPS